MRVRTMTLAATLLLSLGPSLATAACPEDRQDTEECDESRSERKAGPRERGAGSGAYDDPLPPPQIQYQMSVPRLPTPAAAAPAAAVPGRVPVLTGSAARSGSLVPARAYLAGGDIPPKGIGAYGVVSFASLPTTGSRARLLLICDAYKRHFPRNEDLPDSIAIDDRMLTIWPVRNPAAQAISDDDCGAAIADYDLYAGQSAIADAKKQGAKVDGQGPYLIGWSPTHTRGAPDRLVLVVDLSRISSDQRIDYAFRFWRQKIVGDPKLWRSGFSPEQLRLSIKEFVDRYGADLTDFIKITGLGGGQ